MNILYTLQTLPIQAYSGSSCPYHNIKIYTNLGNTVSHTKYVILKIKTLKQQNTKKFGIFKISMETS